MPLFIIRSGRTHPAPITILPIITAMLQSRLSYLQAVTARIILIITAIAIHLGTASGKYSAIQIITAVLRLLPMTGRSGLILLPQIVHLHRQAAVAVQEAAAAAVEAGEVVQPPGAKKKKNVRALFLF